LGQRAEDFRAAGIEPVAIAVTATYSQMAFARHLGVDFPLLSDWSREVSRAYGAAYDVWKGHDGVAKRAVFLIDRDGVVRYRWVTDDAEVLPDLDEVLRHHPRAT
jgi:glutaredoxin-dependent peroxiredoxin